MTTKIHRMRVLSSRGDDESQWMDGDKESVQVAEKKFLSLKAAGYAAFAKKQNTTEIVKTFDPEAEEIVFSRPLVGG